MPQPAFTLTPCPECTAGKHGNCDGTTWDEIADALAACPCLTSGHGDQAPTQSDDSITYVDHEPSLSMMARYGVPAWVTEQRHVHLRGSDRCLKRDGGELCGQVDDDTLARRLEWATGRNGHTLLDQLRAEGLDVIATKPEQCAHPNHGSSDHDCTPFVATKPEQVDR